MSLPAEPLGRDQRIGRRAAVGTLATLALAFILGPFGVAANILLAIAQGAETNVRDAPGVTALQLWRGVLPVHVPWGLFLATSVAFVVLLVLVWNPSRHYLEFWRRRVILIASPVVVAALALLWAVYCVGFGSYYTTKDEWQGGVYIPAAIALAVTVAGAVQAWRLRPRTRRKRARRSAP